MKSKSLLPFLAVFIVFLLIRIYAWSNNYLLEDGDSVSYMSKAKVFLELDYQKIKDGGVDTTPFYPIFSALFSIPGGSIENGARLCSLVFSSVLFIAIVLIGTRVANMGGVLLGLVVLTFSPIMISLSFSVLSEPSYIATIYSGIGLFMFYYKNPRISLAILLGVVFGLGFLNRTEGIIYLAVVPLFHLLQYFFQKGSRHDYKKIVLCNLFYILSFFVVIAPQIYHVSSKMGRLAINGREAWMLIFHQHDGKSVEEKLYGLDYSEREINRKYIQQHPDVQKQLYGNISGNFTRYAEDITREFHALYNTQLGLLIGPVGFMFFAFGLSDLYRRQYFYEITLFLGFITASLIPSLMHNVTMRHIAIIAPMIMLIEGIGVFHVSESLSSRSSRRDLKYLFSVIILFVLLAPYAAPLYKMCRQETNADKVKQYHDNPSSYKEPVSTVRNIAEAELGRKPRILSRKPHISYFADAEHVFTPYTDYDGLVRYAMLNEADFLFLQYHFLEDYPFLDRFREKDTPEFVMISERLDLQGEKTALYRVRTNRKVGGELKTTPKEVRNGS